MPILTCRMSRSIIAEINEIALFQTYSFWTKSNIEMEVSNNRHNLRTGMILGEVKRQFYRNDYYLVFMCAAMVCKGSQ